eukprot:4307790-Pyramimonas_sp.AAC.1
MCIRDRFSRKSSGKGLLSGWTSGSLWASQDSGQRVALPSQKLLGILRLLSNFKLESLRALHSRRRTEFRITLGSFARRTISSNIF